MIRLRLEDVWARNLMPAVLLALDHELPGTLIRLRSIRAVSDTVRELALLTETPGQSGITRTVYGGTLTRVARTAHAELRLDCELPGVTPLAVPREWLEQLTPLAPRRDPVLAEEAQGEIDALTLRVRLAWSAATPEAADHLAADLTHWRDLRASADPAGARRAWRQGAWQRVLVTAALGVPGTRLRVRQIRLPLRLLDGTVTDGGRVTIHTGPGRQTDLTAPGEADLWRFDVVDWPPEVLARLYT